MPASIRLIVELSIEHIVDDLTAGEKIALIRGFAQRWTGTSATSSWRVAGFAILQALDTLEGKP
jgi:hypothetical protein